MSVDGTAPPRPVSHRRAALARLGSSLAGLCLIAIALHFAGLAINVTDSMPIGVYHVIPADRAPVVGDIVRLCPTPNVAAVARSRGYIMRGSCAEGTAPLLKIVAAVANDVVDVRADAISVNGHKLPGSATLPRDLHGRVLAHIAAGTYRVPAGEVWLWTPNPRSWDSRYYGPQPVANVSGYASLLLAFWDWPYAYAR